MKRFMVSYNRGRNCGNLTFDTLAEAELFALVNKAKWVSYSIFSFNSGEVVAVLTEISHEKMS
jgi:hypothetical protein